MAKILVVDDEPHIRHLLNTILTNAGHTVIQAGDGDAACELASQDRPDVILLDIRMPAKDGLSALKELRELSETRSTPVIILTAMPAAEGESTGMKLGVAHYITKPFVNGMVESAVRVALRESRGA